MSTEVMLLLLQFNVSSAVFFDKSRDVRDTSLKLPHGAYGVVIDTKVFKRETEDDMQPGERIPLIGDWLSLYYVRNTGTAFSMFEGNRYVTVLLTSVLIIVCLAVIITEARAGRTLVPVLLTFVAAGGISNLADRFMLGYVTDMISCGSFAVFNVADIAVTCGCILTMLALLLFYREEEA